MHFLIGLFYCKTTIIENQTAEWSKVPIRWSWRLKSFGGQKCAVSHLRQICKRFTHFWLCISPNPFVICGSVISPYADRLHTIYPNEWFGICILYTGYTTLTWQGLGYINPLVTPRMFAFSFLVVLMLKIELVHLLVYMIIVV